MDDPATGLGLIDTTLRVATWNLWWRFGPWEQRLPLIVEELGRDGGTSGGERVRMSISDDFLGRPVER